MDEHKWLIMKDGEVKCYGNSMQSFPSDDLVKTLRGGGYKIFLDGRLYKDQKKGKQKE